MGFLMGITSIFHGGATSANQQANGTANNTTQNSNQWSHTGSGSGKMRPGGRMMKIPSGDQAFFGVVTNVNGNTLTVQRQMRMMGHGNSNSTTPTITPSLPQTITVDLTGSTNYTGGTQSSITTNTRIAGYGTVNSDQSIDAVQIRINPTMQGGFPHHGGPFGGPKPSGNANNNQ